jgi:CBS domain-containing protein
VSNDVKIAYSNQTIREVCKSMHDHGIGSIVRFEGKEDIVSKKKLKREGPMAVGIITERDILSYLGSDRTLSLTRIFDIMSPPLITI